MIEVGANEDWTDVTDVKAFDPAGYRFFKAAVEMKQGEAGVSWKRPYRGGGLQSARWRTANWRRPSHCGASERASPVPIFQYSTLHLFPCLL